MFWVDEIVDDILKKIPKESNACYLITDGFTPSGNAHVGSLRGPLLHDLIRRGLDGQSRQAIFQLDYEDFDPMDGLPVGIDQSFLKYMGIPLCNIPAPDGHSKSFAEQFGQEFEKVLRDLGVSFRLVKTSELYKEGKFNKSIKIVLDHAGEIRQIYKEVSGSDKGSDWYPFQVVCPNCGKIGTTKVTGWDGRIVKFKCVENLVEWAKGCGEEGEISPFDGNGKLPWKVEWPAKWYELGTDIEGEGKDHFVAGGSRDIGDAIFRKIFSAKGRSASGGKIKPPYDIHYEHILVGGKKMASSKGLGVTSKDMTDFLPANILRFLFVRTRAKRAIEFKPEGDTIPLLYDEYDRTSALFQKDPQNDIARAFYFTQIDPSTPLGAGQPKYLLRFSKIAYMLQMPRSDIFEYAKQEKGSDLTEIEKQEIENRISIAKKWLEKFAPENYKFTILDKMPDVNLSEKQKEFLKNIFQLYESKEKWSGEDLHKEIHNIKKDLKIDPRQAFAAIYQIFIGKDSGPQAGWLLASLDRDFVIKRLEEVANA